MRRRVLALVGAMALDAAFGEPRTRWHPVAYIGRLLAMGYEPFRIGSSCEQLAAGAIALGLVAGPAGMLCRFAERKLLRLRSQAGAVLLALFLKPTFAIRQLLEEALGVATALELGQIDVARQRLRALVSRPTANLAPSLVASAAIESVAENLGDSVAAPLFYYVMFGLPGAVVYRIVNTADAMYGYQAELESLGKAAARADDVLSWLPSRLSALALVVAATLLGGVGAGERTLTTWLQDGRLTKSPNAGRPMAAMAGGLRRRLEKQGHYVLGAGYVDPGPDDIRMAVRLAGVAAACIAIVMVVTLTARRP